MTITLFGIPNCDTVKKARMWLDAQGQVYVFHDFKKQGVPAVALAAWVAALGRDALLNRQGTTWRKLDAARQACVVDDPSAIALMCEHASLIKRPVVDWGRGRITAGFKAEAWTALLR